MPFKDIESTTLMAILFDGVKPIVEFCREGVSVKMFFEFGSVVHES